MKKLILMPLLALGLIGTAFAQDNMKADKKKDKMEKKMDKGKEKPAMKKGRAETKKDEKAK